MIAHTHSTKPGFRVMGCMIWLMMADQDHAASAVDTTRIWTDEQFARVAARSRALHGNRHLLAVAACVADRPEGAAISTPEIARGLGGRVPPTKILEVLGRLAEGGLLTETPRLGAPHPRLFYRHAGEPADAFWDFARGLADEAAA